MEVQVGNHRYEHKELEICVGLGVYVTILGVGFYFP